MSDTPFKDRITSTPEGAAIWHREQTILEITDAICGEMDRQRISNTQLAKRMGITRKELCLMLDGESLSIDFVSAVLYTMGCRLKVSIEKDEA